MVYETLETLNATGLNGIFQVSASALDSLGVSFAGLILGAIFIVIAYVSYFSTVRRIGRGDLPASLTVAGFVCVVMAILMSMIPNFIDTKIIVIIIILEIIFAFVLVRSRE